MGNGQRQQCEYCVEGVRITNTSCLLLLNLLLLYYVLSFSPTVIKYFTFILQSIFITAYPNNFYFLCYPNYFLFSSCKNKKYLLRSCLNLHPFGVDILYELYKSCISIFFFCKSQKHTYFSFSLSVAPEF